MFRILAFFTTLAGIGTGIKTGLSSFSDKDDDDKNLVSLTITCLIHSFFWTLLYTLPVYLLQKFWWIIIIIAVIGGIVYISKKGE